MTENEIEALDRRAEARLAAAVAEQERKKKARMRKSETGIKVQPRQPCVPRTVSGYLPGRTQTARAFLRPLQCNFALTLC